MDHKVFRNIIFGFIALVALLVFVSFIWQGIYHFTHMGPCNEQGGYWVNNQCVKGQVTVIHE